MNIHYLDYCILLPICLFSYSILDAQNHADCIKSKYIHIGSDLDRKIVDIPPKGPGEKIEIEAPAKDPYFFEREHHTVWYRFTAPTSGNMTLEITPIDMRNDYDFIIFKDSGKAFCTDLASGIIQPLRSVISRNDYQIESKTGLAKGFEQTHIHSGPGDSYASPLYVYKNQPYILVLDNVYGGGQGHEVQFHFAPEPVVELAEKPVKQVIEGITRGNDNTFTPELIGKVIDHKTGLPLEANVYIEMVRANMLKDSTTSEPDRGTFVMNPILPEREDFMISAKKEGFLPASLVFSYYDYQTDPGDIFELRLVPIEVGAVWVVQSLNFYGNSAELYPESLPHLNDLVTLMVKNPNMKIEIAGHVNGAGLGGTYGGLSAEFSQNLSDLRAETVKNHLVSAGIDSERMTTIGYSDTQMLFPRPMSEGEMKANRRVEVKILEN